MTRKLYFSCATPGSAGNFVNRLIRGLDPDTEYLDFSAITYSQTPPTVITKEFFFENIQIPDTGNYIVSVPFTPDYDKLNTRFPDSKVVVLTHSVEECNTIARAYYQSYFKESYEISSEPFFRNILQTHSHLFSNVNATPDELSDKEVSIFIKILSYQKLLDGFHSHVVPVSSNVVELKFRNLFLNTTDTEQRLEQFIGSTFNETARALTRQMTLYFIEQYFNLNKKLV